METTTFKKVSKVKSRAYDERLLAVCKELMILNKDTSFIISKKFKETSDEQILTEISGLPVIVTTTPINELDIPSCFGLKADYLTNWCDDDPLVRLVYSNIKYTDGEINGRTIKHLYVDIDNIEEVRKAKSYKD